MREAQRLTISDELYLLETDFRRFVQTFEGIRPSIFRKIFPPAGVVVSANPEVIDALSTIQVNHVIPIEPGKGTSQDENLQRMILARLEEVTGEHDIFFFLKKDTNPDHASNPWWEFHITRTAYLAENVNHLQKLHIKYARQDTPTSRVLADMVNTAISLKTQG